MSHPPEEDATTRDGCVSIGAAQLRTVALPRRSTPHPGALSHSPVPRHFHLLPLTINQHAATRQRQLCAAGPDGAPRAMPYKSVSPQSPDLHRSEPTSTTEQSRVPFPASEVPLWAAGPNPEAGAQSLTDISHPALLTG